jgi:WD40 repeat protein
MTGHALAVFDGHGGEAIRVTWSADGMRISAQFVDGTRRMWDARSYVEVESTAARTTWDEEAIGESGACTVAWSADGTRVARAIGATVTVIDVTSKTGAGSGRRGGDEYCCVWVMPSRATRFTGSVVDDELQILLPLGAVRA